MGRTRMVLPCLTGISIFRPPIVVMVLNFGGTDGTETGTQLIKDINPGTANSGAWDFTVSKNILYFAARRRQEVNCG